MKRGIALLNENTEASLTEAVRLFDEALALRRAVIAPGDHWMAYLTAASWMNRADALTRLGRAETIAEAVRSYDEALALMRTVPLEVNPLYRRRLAIAWMNRGISLQQQGVAASFAAAAESFREAMETVREFPEHWPLLAISWMNRGNTLLRTEPPQPGEARACALGTLQLVAPSEQEDLLAGETGLKARYILCQALAELLAAEDAAEGAPDLAAAATDALEEGMRLARHWESRGHAGFRPMLGDFFRFGLAAYREHQPQFLPEFVREHLDPERPAADLVNDRAMHAAAVEALTQVAQGLQAEGFAAVRTPRFDLLLETLKVLQATQNRLDAMAGESPQA